MEETTIENKLLQWFMQKYSKTLIGQQLDKAMVIKREYSGVGFFIHFKIPPNIPMLKLGQDYQKSPLDGPIIVSKELTSGAEAILFIKDGCISMLEVYAFADKFPKNLLEFELQER